MVFLHEGSVAEHKAYYNKLSLRLSILQKSVPSLLGVNAYGLDSARIDRGLYAECLPLMWELELHRVFFMSFTDRKFIPQARVKAEWGSEAAFLNKIYRLCMELNSGFVSVGIKDGKIVTCAAEAFWRYRPLHHG